MTSARNLPTMGFMPLPEANSTELRSVCPFCDSLTQSGRQDPKFYVNLTTGLYYCFHCQIKGKDLPDTVIEGLNVIDEIQRKSFDQSSLAKLDATSEARSAFLTERGLNQDTALFYSPEYKAIAIPVRLITGEIVGIKYRKLDPEAKPRYTSEPGSVNEGHWITGTDNTKLLIVEGELDGFAAVAAGFKGFILATQTNRLNPTQLNHVKTFKNVFLIPDNDLGGLELENSTKELLGPFKVKIIRLDNQNVKDLNELLIKGGLNECTQFIRIQTQTELERDTKNLSSSIPELLAFLSDQRNTIGDSTGWKSFDHLLGGGLRAGEMSVINAFAKTGKTSFVNNLIHNLAESGKQVALVSFEMDPARSIYPTLLSIAGNTNIRAMATETDLLKESVEVIASECSYLNNVTILKRFGYTPWEQVEEWATCMKRECNIDYLVLDHAGFMVEKMTDAEDNQTLAKNIKKLTNTLQLNIMVVVQAPKTKDGLSIQTAYGGLAWAMNADNFIILERSKDNECELRVKLEASRYPGANPSNTPALLFYNRDNCKLTE